jgi:hypothetical protein
MESGTHTVEPSAPKQAKQEEPLSPIYQYVPTEPVILSPYVEVVDTKQKEIDELKEIVRQLIIRVEKA